MKKEHQAIEKKTRAIEQRQRAAFIAGQLATVFIERLGIKFLKGDWKKHWRSMANLDDLRKAMGDARALDKYLEENINELEEEAISDVLYFAKERRNPSTHPVCLEPDHITGDCECDPSPDEVLEAINLVTRDRAQKSIMSWVVTMTDSLKHELKHRRLLETY